MLYCMKKLTDAEFSAVRALMPGTYSSGSGVPPIVMGIAKLLENYQEQLELESYARIELTRYTEENTDPTAKDVDFE